jgi:tripartite-type tricarboxylate transporter receptor subunit TctC
MKFPRRKFLHLAAGAAALPAISRIARAQAYPTRPITMIVPVAAGSTSDVVGRILAERMRAALRQMLYGKASLPAKDLRELIAWLRANPNKASAGVITSLFRMVMASFQKETGTRFTLVPYRGLPPEMQDLVAGQIDFFFDTSAQLPLARAEPSRFLL